MRKNYSDEEIIQEIRRGNSDEVLQFLYQTTQTKLSSWVMRNSGSLQEAQDVFQEAVLSFYQYVLSGKFEEGKSVDAFIFSIGKNKWINRAKQKNRLVTDSDQVDQYSEKVEEGAFEINNVSEDSTKKMEVLLSKLGEICKELLTYSIFYNMSMTDIAESMGFSNANTAKTKNYKCKKRLMKMIKEDEGIKSWLYR